MSLLIATWKNLVGSVGGNTTYTPPVTIALTEVSTGIALTEVSTGTEITEV